jgi:hypothetical protein
MGFSSQSGQVIFRTQTVQGTYNADTGTSGTAMKTRGGSLGPNRELMIPDPEIGGGRDVVDASLGAVSWGGDYDFYARLSSMGTLLKGVLGGTPTIVTTTGVTTNTIPAADVAPPYLSIEEGIGGNFETYNFKDCVVNTLHLEVDANGYLMGTIGIISASQVAGATKTVTPVWDNTPLIVGTNCVITYNAISLPAKNFSLDINNNYEDDDFRLGSFFIGDLTPKRREVTASFGIRESSSALWRSAVYGTSGATTPGGLTTKSALVITCTSYEDIPAGTPATKFSLAITIPQFALTPYAIDVSGDDVIESDIDGQGLRPNPATPILTAVLKNGTPAIA